MSSAYLYHGHGLCLTPDLDPKKWYALKDLHSFLTDYADYMEIINESMTNIGQVGNFDPATIQTWRDAKANPNAIAESGVIVG